jgi:probable rRNA maturation factor
MAGIKIHITESSALVEFNAARLRKMLLALCKRFAVRQGEVSIVIVDDKTIKKINKQFLGRSSVTDVISFDLSDKKTDRIYEFIVYAQLAKRHAKKLSHSAEAELVLYVIHGFLHNVGYDDMKQADARRMHKMEDEILEEFGYGITFAHNTSERTGKRG